MKEEKTVRESIARMSCKPMYKVQEDVIALKQLLSVVSNGLQRNACSVEKLKVEMRQVGIIICSIHPDSVGESFT